MPRRPRDECPGAYQHVVAKGNAGGLIVYDDHDRRDFLTRLGRAAILCQWSCLAYCLMDTHIHLIVRTPEPNLGYGMQRLLSPYAQRVNRRLLREGHLFRGRFYSGRIDRPEHLESAILYVLVNPVRAGMVSRADDWPWSSCAATIGRIDPPNFLDVGATLELVSADPQAARRSLAAAVSEVALRERIAPLG